MTVNGEVASLGCTVDPDQDAVALDGKQMKPSGALVYVVLNKPSGCLVTRLDDRGRRTVFELVQEPRERLFPVGRLDYDTEGVLLLTTDGDLCWRLTHPSYHVEKRYDVLVEGVPTADALNRLREGVHLEDGVTASAKVRVKAILNGDALLDLRIHEGRKRQVKRMCAAVGHPVRRLRRRAFAGITVDGLRPGQWRYLRTSEVDALHRRVGLQARSLIVNS